MIRNLNFEGYVLVGLLRDPELLLRLGRLQWHGGRHDDVITRHDDVTTRDS
jgi:hypothetical protein